MKKVKIAVYLEPNFNPEMGGTFSYYQEFIQGIDKTQFDDGVELIFCGDNERTHQDLSLNREFLHLLDRKPSSLETLIFFILKLIPIFGFRIRRAIHEKIHQKDMKLKEEQLFDQCVHLLFYPYQQPEVVLNYPFIVINWDLAHKTLDSFFDFGQRKNHRARESFYNEYYERTLFRALGVLVESDAGGNELIKYLNFNSDKIYKLPFFGRSFPKECKANIETMNLKKEQYLFYPAGFWTHKNHINLLEAFRNFKDTNHSKIKLAFSGAPKANYEYVKKTVTALELDEEVLFLGFVSEDELHALYQNALALIMPTFLGPTNMPPIEAASLGTPSLCSDLKGHREIMGEAALYFNPDSIEEIKHSMEKIHDQSTRESLIENIEKEKIVENHNIANTMQELNKILIKISQKRKTWELN